MGGTSAPAPLSRGTDVSMPVSPPSRSAEVGGGGVPRATAELDDDFKSKVWT